MNDDTQLDEDAGEVDEKTRTELAAIDADLARGQAIINELEQMGAEMDELDAGVDQDDAELDEEYAADEADEGDFEAYLTSLDDEQEEFAGAMDAHFGALPEGGEAE